MIAPLLCHTCPLINVPDRVDVEVDGDIVGIDRHPGPICEAVAPRGARQLVGLLGDLWPRQPIVVAHPTVDNLLLVRRTTGCTK